MSSVAYKSGAKAPSTKDKIFSDLDLQFKAHPVNKKINVLVNEDAIRRAVRNLILTNKYERFYNPLFGGDIRSYLFENFTPSLSAEMAYRIEETIKSFEPRARVLEVRVLPNIDLNFLDIRIVFEAVNSLQPITLKLTVERVR